jgi:hypothetical protein
VRSGSWVRGSPTSFVLTPLWLLRLQAPPSALPSPSFSGGASFESPFRRFLFSQTRFLRQKCWKGKWWIVFLLNHSQLSTKMWATGAGSSYIWVCLDIDGLERPKWCWSHLMTCSHHSVRNLNPILLLSRCSPWESQMAAVCSAFWQPRSCGHLIHIVVLVTVKVVDVFGPFLKICKLLTSLTWPFLWLTNISLSGNSALPLSFYLSPKRIYPWFSIRNTLYYRYFSWWPHVFEKLRVIITIFKMYLVRIYRISYLIFMTKVILDLFLGIPHLGGKYILKSHI